MNLPTVFFPLFPCNRRMDMCTEGCTGTEKIIISIILVLSILLRWGALLFTISADVNQPLKHRKLTFFRSEAASKRYCQSIQVPALFITFSWILDVILQNVCSSSLRLLAWFSHYKHKREIMRITFHEILRGKRGLMYKWQIRFKSGWRQKKKKIC